MIPASVALERAGIDPTSIGFDGVELGTVGFEVMPGWLRAFIGSRVDGLTIRERVFLTPDVFAAVVRGECPGIVVHELTHVRQWRDGAWTFMRRYLGEYLRFRLLGFPHHGAYLGISHEIEARDAARAFTADPPAPRRARRVPPQAGGRNAGTVSRQAGGRDPDTVSPQAGGRDAGTVSRQAGGRDPDTVPPGSGGTRSVSDAGGFPTGVVGPPAPRRARRVPPQAGGRDAGTVSRQAGGRDPDIVPPGVGMSRSIHRPPACGGTRRVSDAGGYGNGGRGGGA